MSSNTRFDNNSRGEDSLRDAFRLPELGNTPTSVGKTLQLRPDIGDQGKHPHKRGEDSGTAQELQFAQETPPQAWGRRCDPVIGIGVNGNTPTSVGKTPIS